MTKSIDRPNYVNGVGTFQSKDAMHGRTSARCRPSQTVIMQIHHLERMFVDLRVCSVNVGTIRGRSGEIVERLERWSIDICCVQDITFREKSVRMTSRNAAEYW